jgi:hypothetical protein
MFCIHETSVVENVVLLIFSKVSVEFFLTNHLGHQVWMGV